MSEGRAVAMLAVFTHVDDSDRSEAEASGDG